LHLQVIIDVATPPCISVRDHIIAGKQGHASFKVVEADLITASPA
jgi:hypothetical protein